MFVLVMRNDLGREIAGVDMSPLASALMPVDDMPCGLRVLGERWTNTTAPAGPGIARTRVAG
jgi:hypothetical protein